MDRTLILPQFQAVGHDLFIRGIVSSHSGNMSIRVGDRLVITRRDSMLGHLAETDLVETDISGEQNVAEASRELATHRTIYRETPALAVLHAHPPHAIALSLISNAITPVDVEGFLLLHWIPVINWEEEGKPEDSAMAIAQSLKENKIVVIEGHGSFASGRSLDECLLWTSALEQSCHIIYLLTMLKNGRLLE